MSEKHANASGIGTYKPKMCNHEGCTKLSQRGGFCKKHGNVVVNVSPGRLGLTLQFSNASAIIMAIDPACPFKKRINVGDCLESIDGVKVTKMEDLQVGKDKEVRKFSFARRKQEMVAEL